MEWSELTTEELERLEGTFLFRGLAKESLLVGLADEACTRTRFSRGTVIYTPTKFSRSLGVLLAGAVRVTKGELVVSTLEAGELFGAAALFHQRADYETTLTARTDCDVVFFPQTLLERLMGECPGLGANYIRYLEDRIHFLNGKIESLTAPGARQKLARYLLAETEPQGRREDSATELAKKLDVGRASLYRAFDALEEAGAIRRRGKTVVVTDRTALQMQSEA